MLMSGSHNLEGASLGVLSYHLFLHGRGPKTAWPLPATILLILPWGGGHGSVVSDLRVAMGVFDDWYLFSGLRAMQPRDKFQDHSLRATPVLMGTGRGI